MPQESLSPRSFSPGFLEEARRKLGPRSEPDPSLAALAAAAFFALSAMAFVAASVLAPPLVLTPAAKTGVR